MYNIKIYLSKLVCRDTESEHSADRFALAGVVATDQDTAGFMEPDFNINDHGPSSVYDFGPRLVFDGYSNFLKVGFVLQGWDLDGNALWLNNRDEIKKAEREISDTAKATVIGAPYGEALDLIHDGLAFVIDKFCEWDKNDLLLNYSRWHDVTIETEINLRATHTDDTGYSNWDYTLQLFVEHEYIAPGFAPPVEVNPEQDAMKYFRATAEQASREHFEGGFPSFNFLQTSPTLLAERVLLYGAERRRLGLVYAEDNWTPAPLAEWRDVPITELGNVNLADFRERMRQTSLYAQKQGFAAGFPNFFHADYGKGIVCGTVLLHPRAVQYQAVRASDLGSPPSGDIAARFRAVNIYAHQRGFIGGLPDFVDTEWGNGVTQLGTVLVKPMAGEHGYGA